MMKGKNILLTFKYQDLGFMFSFMCFSGCRGLRFEQTGRNLQHSERRNAERSANGFSADARKLSVFAQSYSY